MAADRTLLHGLAHALLHRGPELMGDRAPKDLVLPDEALAAGKWLDLDRAVAVEASAAALLLVLVGHPGAAADGLPVGDAGRGQYRVNPELALDALERDVEVDVAEAVHEHLSRRRIAVDGEGRVLLGEARQRRHDLVLVALAPGTDRRPVRRCGDVDGRRSVPG